MTWQKQATGRRFKSLRDKFWTNSPLNSTHFALHHRPVDANTTILLQADSTTNRRKYFKFRGLALEAGSYPQFCPPILWKIKIHRFLRLIG
jgi:hypothetical protein